MKKNDITTKCSAYFYDGIHMRNLIFFLIPFFSFGQITPEQVNTYFEQKEYAKAEKLVQKRLSSEPENPVFVELLGDALGYQERWKEAKKQYKKLAKQYPDSAKYHYKYGGVLGIMAKDGSKLRALGMLGDIKYHLKKAAKLDPNHIEVRWALVELYIQLPGIVGGSKKRGLAYAQELENISPVDGYLAKGYIYEYEDEPLKAEMYYKMAIDTGGSLTCFGKLTDLYEKQDQPLKAIANIESAQKKHQRNALHYQIGKIAAEYNVSLSKGEMCLHTYIQNHTVQDGVPVEWAYLRLAQIYKHKRDKEKALQWVEKALSVRSDFEQALSEKQAIIAI